MKDYPTTILSKDVYLMGYSQGGWATMALKKELETNLTAEGVYLESHFLWCGTI